MRCDGRSVRLPTAFAEVLSWKPLDSSARVELMTVVLYHGRSGVLKPELDGEGLNLTRAVSLLRAPLSTSLLSPHSCSTLPFERI